MARPTRQGIPGTGGGSGWMGMPALPPAPIRPRTITPAAIQGVGMVQPPPPPAVAPIPFGEQLKRAFMNWMAGTNTRGPNSGSEDMVPGEGVDKFRDVLGL